jgi:hypothetical protein
VSTISVGSSATDAARPGWRTSGGAVRTGTRDWRPLVSSASLTWHHW